MARPILTELEIFLSHVEPEPMSGCHLWTASVSGKGHGKFHAREGGRRVRMYAHRWAYRNFVGPIPDGIQVLHRCDNMVCVNPDHLFLGTSADNRRDMAAKGRGIKSKLGFPFGVSPHHANGRYRATVSRDGRQVFVGSFSSIEEAGAAALKYKEALYGRSAK